jgi:DNA polymerase-3 subunit epsilon
MLGKILHRTKNDSTRHPGRFAVVDVETTGLFPRANDRVVEIAIVQLDGGDISDEFVTLINPQRDVGPTRIHGIAARDVLNAPTFGEVAGDVVRRLTDRVFVAHNARFDHDFVAAEFARIGCQLPSIPTLCTMQLACGGSLDSLCNHFNIDRDRAHSALDDARATARLLEILLSRIGSTGMRPGDFVRIQEGPSVPWPNLVASGRSHTRQRAAHRQEPHYISRLVERLPPAGTPTTAENHLEYVDLLNRVLEDRKVVQAEADALVEVATHWGLTKEQAVAIHTEYLAAVVQTALEDGTVTEVERSDLNIVAQLLGFDQAFIAERLDALNTPPASQRRLDVGRGQNQLRGLSVCFTGDSCLMFRGESVSRALAERLAVDAGMLVKGSVTKKLDLLVTVDADSLSGKARKAREYGTRVMAETVFWQLVGVEMQ